MTLRVMTWNVWWRFGAWGERQGGLLQTMRDSSADIIAVQECWPDQIKGFAEALDFHWVTSQPDPDHEVGFVNAIMSRWPIDISAQDRLPSLTEPAHRSMLFARSRTPFGPVPIVTTHLDYQYDRSAHRETQLEAVSKFALAHRDDSDQFPTLLMGDLNAVPESDEVRRLTGRSRPYADGLIWSDVWEQVGDGPGHTWNEGNPNLEDPAWPNRRLDYVMIQWPRNKPLGNPVAATLVGTRTLHGAVPSDHYAVVADLRSG